MEEDEDEEKGSQSELSAEERWARYALTEKAYVPLTSVDYIHAVGNGRGERRLGKRDGRGMP